MLIPRVYIRKEEESFLVEIKFFKIQYYRKQRPVAPKLPDPSTLKPQDIDSSDGTKIPIKS